MIKITDYQTLVFDCDGVILNSNKVKTEGFWHVAQRYGDEAAKALVDFHTQNGGISRYKKFEYLLVNILGQQPDAALVELLSKDYGDYVYQRLLTCEITPHLQQLREQTSSASWMLVSGGSQVELRKVFDMRGLTQLFDKGIYGSPTNKDEIFNREISAGNLKLPALFVGDSRYDHQSSTRAGMDFIFAYGWTEFLGWEEYCEEFKIKKINAVIDLIY